MTEAAPEFPEAKLSGGSYDVIRRRLLEQAAELGAKASLVNEKRKALFGGRALALVGTERVRTENNCVPRDVVSVSGHLLFGFQVFIGLRAETKVSDVFSLHRFARVGEGYDLAAAPFEGAGAFLADPGFDKELRDVFRYYKSARLLQLRRTEQRLLVVVQIGDRVDDVKVFRFAIDARGGVTFMDARGEDDFKPPRSHPFEWTITGREQQVSGRHPHVNILDQLFVETVNGDLTVKVENNTEDGLGIYREPVLDRNQTLDDAEIAYAKVGGLLLLRVKPFREEQHRYLVFNPRTSHVIRVDAIGAACVELPENHGIIFPGGYYLESGEHRVFDVDGAGLEFERTIPSPNGEDVLFVFYRKEEGEYALLPYNMIRKEVENPIRCHGYSLFADGTMVIFRSSPSEEPSRVHPVQIWQTPFVTAEFAASEPTGNSYLGKVGNADLVRGLSDALSIQRLAESQKPTRRTFEDIVASARRLVDANYWLGHAEAEGLLSAVETVRETSALVVDEFEKMRAIEKRAREAVAELAKRQDELLGRVRPADLTTVDAFLSALTELTKHRGQLVTLRELRSVDKEQLATLEKVLVERFDEVSRAAVSFFAEDTAWKPLLSRLDALVAQVPKVERSNELAPLVKELDGVQGGLELLTGVVSALKVDDVTARTRILEGVSSALAQQNRARAVLDGRMRELSTAEGRGEFAVQFKLLGQSVTSALALANTPEACDEQLARLLLQVEELEGRFGQLEEFAPALAEKREDVVDAVAARREALVEERRRRADSLASAAERIVAGVARRAQGFGTADELNAYFASDPMVHKVADLREKLLALGDSVRADELESKLKTARQGALRTLRDKTDLFDGDSNLIRFGVHRFLVNTQPLDLAVVPREGALYVHLTGTDFHQKIEDATLEASRDLWDQALVSESPDVYRGEFLAVSLFREAEAGASGHTQAELEVALREGKLESLVRDRAAQRIDEGYERGVHDHDAALILERLLALTRGAGLLRYSPGARGLSWLFWQDLPADRRDLVERRARSAGRLRDKLGDFRASVALASELGPALREYTERLGLGAEVRLVPAATEYLVRELAREGSRFLSSTHAAEVEAGFHRYLTEAGVRSDMEEDLRVLAAHPPERLAAALSFVDAFLGAPGMEGARPLRLELAARALWNEGFEREESSAPTSARVDGLLGVHSRVQGRALTVAIDETFERVGRFIDEQAPRYREYKRKRTLVAERERARLRLDEFSPRVLSSFVRNRLIDEVYLPIIGANLAKQIGAAGDKKRTDLMGLLLLVSPPGYGKTTLMEYVASRLGLVFMKVNGPALGTEVRSLDPAEAPNATARQEVEKINLALEMGNNVMLYLDDIQHTHPELLQKFISLCDAQRRIEGVWAGKTRTYDLRGKKFCVVMAGNPYTESGARFQIPDMLANRADTYNLGDILEGKSEAFALSYLENALTSNGVLAPLATREQKDVHLLIAKAQGKVVADSELSYQYSAAELGEIVAVLSRLLTVQRVLLRVNQEYIASASQDDQYRSEPPFKLQGSYRNMSKLAEKVASAMNEEELERLIDDHYTGEAQTLTKGAEQNLLKLADLRGRLTPEQATRWAAVKEGFARVQRMGGKADDPVARLTGSLAGLDDQLKGIRRTIEQAAGGSDKGHVASEKLALALSALGRPRIEVELTTPSGGVEAIGQRLEIFERQVLPLLSALSQGAGNGLGGQLEAIQATLSGLHRLVEQGGGGIRRLDVPLEESSATNLYRTLSSPDVCSGGGVFVATYEKPPSLGSPVLLSLTFPRLPPCEVRGAVLWVQDEIGEHAPPGFGVRFVDVPEGARGSIQAFARAREPLLRDD